MKHKKEFLIGIIVIATLLILIFGINFLKGKVLTAKHTTYYAIFPSVEGLLQSGSVYMNGMRVGNISDITNLNSTATRFAVAFSLRHDIDIPDDSKAVIFSAGIMGGNNIKIVPGQSTNYLNAKDTIVSKIEEGTLSTIAPMVEKVGSVLNNLDTTLVALQRVLSPKNQENIEQSFASIRISMENMRQITDHVNQVVTADKEKVRRIIANAEKITTNIEQNSAVLTNAIENFSQISDSISKIQFKKTIEQTDKVLASLDQLLRKINNGDGSLGLLVQDETLYKELTASAKEMNALISAIKANPKKYLRLSVF